MVQKQGRARFGDAEERQYEEQMAVLGCCIKPMAADGSCLFHAIADQMEGEFPMMK
jgi:hypothetical protein